MSYLRSQIWYAFQRQDQLSPGPRGPYLPLQPLRCDPLIDPSLIGRRTALLERQAGHFGTVLWVAWCALLETLPSTFTPTSPIRPVLPHL